MAWRVGHEFIPTRLANVCCFHTNIINMGKSNPLRKMLAGPKKKKHKFCDIPVLPTPITFTKHANEGKKSVSSKRVDVLNKLFLRHITDLMTNSEHAEEYYGLGIEVQSVKVTPDFKLLQVYWCGKDAEKDDIAQAVLVKHAGAFRQELTNLRVIGAVPKIMFVKDKQKTRLREVEKQLLVADFGDEYVAPNATEKLKSALELYIPLAPEEKEKVLKVDGENICDELIDNPIPAMTHSIYGLNHSCIMGRVMQLLRKSKSKETGRALGLEDVSYAALHSSVNENPIKFDNDMSQKEAIKKFLIQRQLQKSRLKKQNKNYNPDKEYIICEMEKQREMYFSQMSLEDYTEDQDYIVEDEEEKP